jgi:hypothetical protein
MVNLNFTGVALALAAPATVDVMTGPPTPAPPAGTEAPKPDTVPIPTRLLTHNARDELARQWLKDFYRAAGDSSPWELPEGIVRGR